MKIKDARNTIQAILSAIPDDEFPPFDRVEIDKNGLPILWWGSTGACIGRATRGGVREPKVLRTGADEAIQQEAVYRADRRLFRNGDDPTGLDFTGKEQR